MSNVAEQIEAAAEELSASQPDAAEDLREYAARMTEAWEKSETLGDLSIALYELSKNALRAHEILRVYGK
ncbi:hypothetical protein ACIBAH_34845 [Streptomyces sp. NPDC051445]|uniref:hypothetical protein n=1 Tax=Streptomyces sp. NPDC051445 TaxID=3365653 RepID=UPI0037AE10C3